MLHRETEITPKNIEFVKCDNYLGIPNATKTKALYYDGELEDWLVRKITTNETFMSSLIMEKTTCDKLKEGDIFTDGHLPDEHTSYFVKVRNNGIMWLGDEFIRPTLPLNSKIHKHKDMTAYKVIYLND